MKKLILLITLLLLISYIGSAQKKLFVRIFDQSNHKIGKGYILNVSDSEILVGTKAKQTTFKYQQIGSIKTKRSFGNSVLIGSLIAGTPLAIILAATSCNDCLLGWSTGDGILTGFTIGGSIGALVGSGIAALKSKDNYVINGDIEKWKKFKTQLSFYTTK